MLKCSHTDRYNHTQCISFSVCLVLNCWLHCSIRCVVRGLKMWQLAWQSRLNVAIVFLASVNLACSTWENSKLSNALHSEYSLIHAHAGMRGTRNETQPTHCNRDVNHCWTHKGLSQLQSVPQWNTLSIFPRYVRLHNLHSLIKLYLELSGFYL